MNGWTNERTKRAKKPATELRKVRIVRLLLSAFNFIHHLRQARLLPTAKLLAYESILVNINATVCIQPITIRLLPARMRMKV